LCIFDKKGTADGEWKIRTQGEKVSSVKSIKCSGLHLNSILDWEDEINAVVGKCEIPMKIVNCVKHNLWRADPVILMRLYKALIRTRMECGAFLFHKLKKKQLQKRENLQFREIRRALGYRSNTPTNCKFKQMGSNYVPRSYTSINYPMVQLLEVLSTLADNPGRIENEQSLISIGHVI
jgi:hypothetical protein